MQESVIKGSKKNRGGKGNDDGQKKKGAKGQLV